MASTSGVPPEIIEKLRIFSESLNKLEDLAEEFDAYSKEKQELTSLETAENGLASLFTLNSLYWSYLCCLGKNPKENDELAIELSRTKKYLAEFQKLLDLAKRPKYDAKTVSRFVKHSLYDDENDQKSPHEKNELNGMPQC